MLNAGEGAKMGGRSMTGVSGPSGVVRSTTFRRPACSSSMSCDKISFGIVNSLEGFGRATTGVRPYHVKGLEGRPPGCAPTMTTQQLRRATTRVRPYHDDATTLLTSSKRVMVGAHPGGRP